MCVTEQNSELVWFTLPDLATELGLPIRRIRQYLEERDLLAVRRDGVLQVPSSFIADGGPVHNLRGTLTLLSDNGFDDEAAMVWMLEDDDAIGTSPIEALREGRRSEVRRVAQALA
nr:MULTISPECIES: Rv2175c family DNA-binding protein [unclassified Plantibacter]